MSVGEDPAPHHATVPLVPPGRRKPIAVDAEMADLVQAIWSHGLKTHACCQADADDPAERAYVVFDYDEFPDFLLLVASAASASIAREASQAGWRSEWSLTTWAAPMGRDRASLRMSVKVRFPRRQIADIARAVATAP